MPLLLSEMGVTSDLLAATDDLSEILSRLAQRALGPHDALRHGRLGTEING